MNYWQKVKKIIQKIVNIIWILHNFVGSKIITSYCSLYLISPFAAVPNTKLMNCPQMNHPKICIGYKFDSIIRLLHKFCVHRFKYTLYILYKQLDVDATVFSINTNCCFLDYHTVQMFVSSSPWQNKLNLEREMKVDHMWPVTQVPEARYRKLMLYLEE